MRKPTVLANALAGTTAIIYVVCRLLVGIFPDLSFTVAQSWFHGIGLTKLGSGNLTTESFILGIVSATITAWAIGFVFAYVYNYFAKGK